MKKAIEKLGLHLAVLLHTAGADDQAYDEIIESLERAKERAKQDAPNESPEDPQDLKRTMETDSMRLLLCEAN